MEPQGMKSMGTRQESPENGAQNLPGAVRAARSADEQEALQSLVRGREDARLLYVVLHHTGIEDPHFDLMVQTPFRERLMTWRIRVHPETWGDAPPEVDSIERLPDHRAIYMRYEGPVSGDRGEVRRIRAGECRVLAVAADRLTVEILMASAVVLELPLEIGGA